MPRRNLRRRLAELAAEFEPEIRREFLAAIADIRDTARVGAIAEALERGNIERALELINVDPAAFRRMEAAMARAFEAGGIATTGTFPAILDREGVRMVFRFDVRNPRAEEWLTRHSSEMVTRIVEDQRLAIRTALREGMEAGRNPRNVALDIVGRVNRATGRREGGVIGLTSPQERAVANARAELISGDPARMRAYFERARRDRRFDRTIMAAIREERALDRATVDRIMGRYSDRLLQLRGETIARTEAMASLNQAQVEAYRQAIDTGAVRRQDVRKVWVATKDNRTRDSHAHLDGESVGVDDRFANGLEYPGDPNGPASEIVNCRCTMLTRVDFLANVE